MNSNESVLKGFFSFFNKNKIYIKPRVFAKEIKVCMNIFKPYSFCSIIKSFNPFLSMALLLRHHLVVETIVSFVCLLKLVVCVWEMCMKAESYFKFLFLFCCLEYIDKRKIKIKMNKNKKEMEEKRIFLPFLSLVSLWI